MKLVTKSYSITPEAAAYLEKLSVASASYNASAELRKILAAAIAKDKTNE